MTHLQIAIAVYLVGYVVSYLLFRWCVRRNFQTWTKGDRAHVLILSALSWITVLFVLIFERVQPHKDDDASW